VIPGDNELLHMPGRELQALAMKHGIGCKAHADMRVRLSQSRDHGLLFCLACEDGMNGLYIEIRGASYLPTSQPEHLSLLYVCTYTSITSLYPHCGHLLI
jgi:hypothetical protein